MNEEEIIKNIKEMIQWSDYNTYKIALQGILDLYKQEKARNKDLEQIEKEHKEENGRLREELEKIEYIKRNFDYCLERKTKELKDKIIDLMAEELADWYMDNLIENRKIDKQYVINKFTNKVEEDIKE